MYVCMCMYVCTYIYIHSSCSGVARLRLRLRLLLSLRLLLRRSLAPTAGNWSLTGAVCSCESLTAGVAGACDWASGASWSAFMRSSFHCGVGFGAPPRLARLSMGAIGSFERTRGPPREVKALLFAAYGVHKIAPHRTSLGSRHAVWTRSYSSSTATGRASHLRTR